MKISFHYYCQKENQFQVRPEIVNTKTRTKVTVFCMNDLKLKNDTEPCFP